MPTIQKLLTNENNDLPNVDGVDGELKVYLLIRFVLFQIERQFHGIQVLKHVKRQKKYIW